jgi:cytochrome P450
MHSGAIHFRPPAPIPQAQPLGPIALLKTLRVNALECWTKAHFEEPIVLGGCPFASVAVVSEPAAVRQVLVEDQAAYSKSRLERRVLSARLRNGLVAVDGEQWQRLRRILAPLFARKTIIGFAPQMALAVECVAGHWQTLSEGSTVVMKTEMLRLALESLVRCIFADGIGDPKSVCEATTRFYSTCGTLDPFDLLGFPDFVPRLTRLRERPILRAFDEGLYRAIAEKRRNLADASKAPRDMLGAMVTAKDPETGQGMSDKEVRDNVMTFIFGGQETTSSALTWAFYLLSQSAEWRERVLKEASRFDDITRHEAVDALADTRAVVEEALRLYPPIIAITRTALRRTEICGRTIEHGTLVVVPPYVIHRHRLLWRDPDLFDPNRFLPGAREKIERYTFLPFGVGPRMCVGATFAVQEATLALAILTRQFAIDVAPGEIVWPVQKNFTMRPRGGLRMTVARRRVQ